MYPVPAKPHSLRTKRAIIGKPKAESDCHDTQH